MPATAAAVSFTAASSYTLQPGVYYLAYCADNTVGILTAIVDFAGLNPGNFFGGGAANTFGVDSATADKCTTGTFPSTSISISNITNSNTVEIPAVMITN
jgi:hypothetical protein